MQKNMQKICKKYAEYAAKICNKYALNMQNMHKSMYLHILHIYALNMHLICRNMHLI